MRRAIAALALVPLLAAGCGKSLVVTGMVVTTYGLVAAAIPDEHKEPEPCDPNGPCFGEVDFNVNESRVLITGLVLMGLGAAINAWEHDAQSDRVEKKSWTPPPITVADAEPPPESPPPGSPNGVWRDVPPGPEE